MPITLDQVLNAVIPVVVWIFLGYILYKPFKEPIGKLINLFKRMAGRVGGNKEEQQEWNFEKAKLIDYE